MLNAFRHQRFLRSGLGLFPCHTTKCSTPFGIKDFCVDPQPVFQVDRGCSTPFGIKDFCVAAKQAFRELLTCSTPFGIKDFCVEPIDSPAAAIVSAQRLSASKISALSKRRRLSTGNRSAQRLSASKISASISTHLREPSAKACSTPFGIKDFCVAQQTHTRGTTMMCSTPFGIKDFCVCNFPLLRRVLHHCAQRLSASKISALIDKKSLLEFLIVLNAFRHQRFLRIHHSLQRHLIFPVLNAFRHQRFLRRSERCSSRPSSDSAQRLSASKISASPASIRSNSRCLVLNAFRHQRFLRNLAGREAANALGMCSTPFGIKDFCV